MIFLFIFISIELIKDQCSKYKMDISENYKQMKVWNYMVARKIWKTSYNTEFDIIITCTDQNGSQFEIEY